MPSNLSSDTTSSRSDDTDDEHHFKTSSKIQTCQEQSSLNKNMTPLQPTNPANRRGKAKKGRTMNPLTQFKKTLILPILIALSLVVVVAVPARATPACGLSTVILALEHFPSGSLDLMCNEFDLYGWNLKLKVQGDSDVYIVQNTFPVGAHTGWHTHPGPSLVTVTAGTITAYEADAPNCTPTVYHAGESFTDLGCGDVHLLRNEGPVCAVTIAVQIIPAGQMRRLDRPQPANCPTFTCPSPTPTPCPQ
jgi:quercetin dioxygenase-like cupin family protein